LVDGDLGDADEGAGFDGVGLEGFVQEAGGVGGDEDAGAFKYGGVVGAGLEWLEGHFV